MDVCHGRATVRNRGGTRLRTRPTWMRLEVSTLLPARYTGGPTSSERVLRYRDSSYQHAMQREGPVNSLLLSVLRVCSSTHDESHRLHTCDARLYCSVFLFSVVLSLVVGKRVQYGVYILCGPMIVWLVNAGDGPVLYQNRSRGRRPRLSMFHPVVVSTAGFVHYLFALSRRRSSMHSIYFRRSCQETKRTTVCVS